VVGGCAVITLKDGSALTLLGVIAGGLFIVGIVYLTTSMSRDGGCCERSSSNRRTAINSVAFIADGDPSFRPSRRY
jgi:hypothetical protein